MKSFAVISEVILFVAFANSIPRLITQNIKLNIDNNCTDVFSWKWLGRVHNNSGSQGMEEDPISCNLEGKSGSADISIDAECRGPDILTFDSEVIVQGMTLTCTSSCDMEIDLSGVLFPVNIEDERYCSSWKNFKCKKYTARIVITFNPNDQRLLSSGKYNIFCKHKPNIHRDLYVLFHENTTNGVIGGGNSIELVMFENSTQIIIPCMPNIWDSPLSLTQINRTDFLELSNLSTLFDPTIGFVLPGNGNMSHLSGDYVCVSGSGQKTPSVTFQVRSAEEIASRVQGEVQLDTNTGAVSCSGNVSSWVVTVVSASTPVQRKYRKNCLNRGTKHECDSAKYTFDYNTGQLETSYVNTNSGMIMCREKRGIITSDLKQFIRGVDDKFYTIDDKNENEGMPRGAIMSIILIDKSLDDSWRIKPKATIFPGNYHVECTIPEYIFQGSPISVMVHSEQKNELVNSTVIGYQTNLRRAIASVQLDSSHNRVSCRSQRTDTLIWEIRDVAFQVKAPSENAEGEPGGTDLFYLYGSLSIIGFALIFCVIIFLRWHRLNKMYVQTSQELKEFKYGRPVDTKNTDDNRNSQIKFEHSKGRTEVFVCGADHDFDPYDEKFEIQDFTIHEKELGSGCYGVVNEGIVSGKKVAVKICRQPVDKMCLESLKSELKLLIFIQNQVDNEDKNILKLIGANTKRLKFGELYLFLEFCEFGNLAKYMNEHTIVETMEVSETPDRGHYHTVSMKTQNLTFRKLALWSFQIANGMEYLASKNVIHIDLAARNILLFDENSIRICDFGLSRKLIHDIYVKEKSESLPIQWLPPESLNKERLTFSTKSDVWSYGVTLWEIYSLAAKEPNLENGWDSLRIALMNGKRLGRPKYANSEKYSLMLKCWDLNPCLRPSFLDLKNFFQNVIENTPENLELSAVILRRQISS